MLKGICPGCETVFWGWGLAEEKNQVCDCGDKLKIIKTPGPDLYKRAREGRVMEDEDEEE